MKIVIAALVRGYPNKSGYKSLLKRNKYIYKNITSKINYTIDLILFHEGNISLDHQNYINKKSPDKYNFIDVSKDFDYKKENLANIPDLERFGIGYRLMCKFNFFHIWSYVDNYDYLIRIDEDVLIKKFDSNYFDNINSNFVFGTANLTDETHTYTNNSLPDVLQKIFNTSNQSFYNHKFPYTNFYITKLDFWKDSELNSTLRIIAENNKQLLDRWGDLPVLGSVLNYMEVQITILKNIKYTHLSHQNKFKISKKIRS